MLYLIFVRLADWIVLFAGSAALKDAERLVLRQVAGRTRGRTGLAPVPLAGMPGQQRRQPLPITHQSDHDDPVRHPPRMTYTKPDQDLPELGPRQWASQLGASDGLESTCLALPWPSRHAGLPWSRAELPCGATRLICLVATAGRHESLWSPGLASRWCATGGVVLLGYQLTGRPGRPDGCACSRAGRVDETCH